MLSQTNGDSSLFECSSSRPKPGFRMSVDLVAAARKHISFLRTVRYCTWLHETGALVHAIRRYHELWMPLYAQICDSSPLILPPLDVQYIWFCHTLNSAAYRRYCMSRFSKLIEKPAIFDDENEDYALSRCKEIWKQRYPLEPDSGSLTENTNIDGVDLLAAAIKQLRFYEFVSEPFWRESSFLVSAKLRYRGFIYLLQKFGNLHSVLVPTIDIILMSMTHQSFPASYSRDMGDTEIFGDWESVKEEDLMATARLWEGTFDHPYERAGMAFGATKSPFYWEASVSDVSRTFKSLQPRFLTEVCIFMKGNIEEGNIKNTLLRLKTVRCHKQFKMDRQVSSIVSSLSGIDCWRKEFQLWCEFGTRGVILELRQMARSCFQSDEVKESVVFSWEEMIRAPSLTVGRELTVTEKQGKARIRVVASMTPPVQAPYLLKCVPDRVTDDSGAMISEVILRMNKYRPQEGRWLSRTVLDHRGKECFVIRIRVAQGFWRRGGDNPRPVKWEDRIIQVCDGSWSYVADSVGKAPEKVVATATPKVEAGGEPSRDKKVVWSLSTGYELTIQWGKGFDFCLESTSGAAVKLLKGRKLQYEVPETDSGNIDVEDGFITLIRYSLHDPIGRATALLNWKLFAVEFLPEEDAAMALLLSTVIARTVSEVKRENVGNLLVRRRLKQAKAGTRDWGSLTLSQDALSHLKGEISPEVHLQPWHWNAKEVMSLPEISYVGHTGIHNYSNADGGDQLYRGGI